MNSEYSLKELYQVVIKPTQNIEVEGRTIEAGEVVAAFDKIQLANFQEIKKYSTANGGANNLARVWWETSNQLTLILRQGIFSSTQWAIMDNARLFRHESVDLWLNQIEQLESDGNGEIQVSYAMADKKPYVYDKTGNKLEIISYSASTKKIKINDVYKDVVVHYTRLVNNNFSNLVFGSQLSNGFFTLEGRTRVKDDITGKVRTGIIYIPKLKLMTDLSLRLGGDATPVVGELDAIACPVGSRGNMQIMSLYILDEELEEPET